MFHKVTLGESFFLNIEIIEMKITNQDFSLLSVIFEYCQNSVVYFKNNLFRHFIGSFVIKYWINQFLTYSYQLRFFGRC